MNNIHRLLLLALFTLVMNPNNAYPDGLSAKEEAITQWVSEHLDEALDSVEAVLAIDSATENLAGVREMGAYFEPLYKELGFRTEWIDMVEVTDRAGHFQAELEGGSGKRLLLLGHIDTVLPVIPVRSEGNHLFGSGSDDMKSGDIVMLFALKALYQAGALDDRRIIVHLTGDEESVGRPIDMARAPMVNAALRSDLALSFEGGSPDTAVVARRSSSSWHLLVKSPSGHSSRIFSEEWGFGANYEAVRIINAFREQLQGEKYLTFNTSLIAGGTTAQMQKSDASAWGKSNVIAAVAQVRGDLRVISIEQLERTKARMTEIVTTNNLPHTTASIEFDDSYPPMSPKPGNLDLLVQYSRVSRDLEYENVEAYDPGARGAGDIAFIAHLLPGLDGLGADGKGAHADIEYMEIDSLERQIQRAALLIYRLTHQDSQ